MSDIKAQKDWLIQKFGEEKTELLCWYMDEILIKNDQINLTAVTDPSEFLQKHIIDSLSCVDSPEFQKSKKIVDMGTGGGFPGIPLAIAAPDKEFVLADSLNKRLKVITELTEKLGITNVSVLHTRAEDMGQDPQWREQFDICVSRAVASLDILAEWCIPLVKKGGCFISYKGEKSDEELKDAGKAIAVLGGKLDRKEIVGVKDSMISGHTLLFIKKIKSCPKKYPRKPGLAKKTPIR